jgi:hypothetical protein
MGYVRTCLALACGLAALTLAGAAGATVRVVTPAGSVTAGDKASVTVSVSPASRCTIAVVYASGRSEARGLGSKKGSRITWTWTVGSNTKPGRWPITVSCGAAGTAKTSIRVR